MKNFTVTAAHFIKGNMIRKTIKATTQEEVLLMISQELEDHNFYIVSITQI